MKNSIALARRSTALSLSLVAIATCLAAPLHGKNVPPKSEVLRLLNIEPPHESVDFTTTKTQFQLHTLMTEQRHKKTWSLSSHAKKQLGSAVEMLLSVDEDISVKIRDLAKHSKSVEEAAAAVETAILSGHKIYFFGSGASGRLAKLLESGVWRPFWSRAKAAPPGVVSKLNAHFSEAENRLIGEMAGGDRALIGSLPGLDDLPLTGELQLEDRGIAKGDVVFALSDCGESSAVIGTIQAAAAQWGKLTPKTQVEAKQHLYFVYNNPDEALRPFDRSRAVIENSAITKISLATGPQAIAGSTRMQATTIQAYVLGVILEHALQRALRRHLNSSEIATLGFSAERKLADRLLDFVPLQGRIFAASERIAAISELEATTYAAHRFTTYLASGALVTVFTDATERSPTFRLLPLDTASALERHSWVQVWTPAANGPEAWLRFLGRPFRGLELSRYEGPIRKQVTDPYLQEAALRGLREAGNDQQRLYNFGFSDASRRNTASRDRDLGVLVLLTDERHALSDEGSAFSRWIANLRNSKAVFATIAIAPAGGDPRGPASLPGQVAVSVSVDPSQDPLGVRQQVALKMILNAHSTAVMAKLGRVVGNTMTNVSPANLKLVGRATFLIQSHVNDVLQQPEWKVRFGEHAPITYADANAVLFEAIRWVKGMNREGVISEVGISIVRMLEAFQRKNAGSWESAASVLDEKGLEGYLAPLNPTLAG